MNERKCGVEPCPICKKTPIAVETTKGFTIGCGNKACDYFFLAQNRTLELTLIIWNKQTKRILKLCK